MAKTLINTSKAVNAMNGSAWYTFYLTVVENSTNIANNTSNITVTYYGRYNYSGNGFSGYTSSPSTEVIRVNGSQKASIGVSGMSNTAQQGGNCTWTGDVAHNVDGSGTITVEGSFTANHTTYYFPVNNTISGSASLTNIPRYATVAQSMVSKTETTIDMKWSSDSTVDYIWYSTDNGGKWTGIDVADGTSGTYTISGLKANTTYQVKTRVRRKDSQLTTDSSMLSIATYQYPYVSAISTKDLTIGDSQKVTIYNPLKRNVTVYMNNTSGTQFYSGTTTGTEITFTPNADSLYKSIPNSPNGSAVYYCVYSSQTVQTVSGTYKVPSTSVPSFSNFTFADVNEKTVALTGNDQDCIVGYSNIKVTVPVDDKATSTNYATMSKYRFTVGDKTTENPYSDDSDVSLQLDGVSNGNYNVYAIDSRTQAKLVQKVARNVIPYAKPIIDSNCQVTRNQGASEESTLNYSGTIWNGDFGAKENSIVKATYRYRESTKEEWVNGTTVITPTISDNGRFSFRGNIKGDTNTGFNINNAYYVEVTITDELSIYSITTTLIGGKPHVAYAKNGVSIMGPYNESNGGKLQIDGIPVLDYEVVETW